MSNTFANRARLGCENLEGRDMMSWGMTAPAMLPSGGDRFTFPTGSANGSYQSTNSAITRGENDAYSFTAARTGTYTFDAKKTTGSSIDTVIALYDSGNRLLRSNDDWGGTSNSHITCPLVAGQRYTVAVSKYNGTSNGAYTLTFSEPVLTGSASVGSLIYTSGDAMLKGNTLTVNLYGLTGLTGYYTDHYINVRILDANGRAIHGGQYSLSAKTDKLPFGNPASRNETTTFNVANLDLSRAVRLEVIVGYR